MPPHQTLPLPNELILHILSFLPPVTLLTVIPLVCRHLEELSHTPSLHQLHFKHIRDPEFHRTDKDSRLPPPPFPARTFRELHLRTFRHLPYLNQLVVSWENPKGVLGVTRYNAPDGTVRIHLLDSLEPIEHGGDLTLGLIGVGSRIQQCPREEGRHEGLWMGAEPIECYESSGIAPDSWARVWVLDPARWRDVPEGSAEGIWIAEYGPHGPEIALLVREGAKLKAVKLTGDINVPSGEVTWEVDEWEGEGKRKGRGRVAYEGFTDPSWVDAEVQQLAPDLIRVDWIISVAGDTAPSGMYRSPVIFKKLNREALKDVVDGKETELDEALPSSQPAQWIPPSGLLPFVESLFGGLEDDDQEGVQV